VYGRFFRLINQAPTRCSFIFWGFNGSPRRKATFGGIDSPLSCMRLSTPSQPCLRSDIDKSILISSVPDLTTGGRIAAKLPSAPLDTVTVAPAALHALHRSATLCHALPQGRPHELPSPTSWRRLCHVQAPSRSCVATRPRCTLPPLSARTNAWPRATLTAMSRSGTSPSCARGPCGARTRMPYWASPPGAPTGSSRRSCAT
jgi:hypothetical protein